MSTKPVPMSERERKARKWCDRVEDHYADEDPNPLVIDARDGADHLRAALDECAALRQQLADARALVVPAGVGT